MFASALCGAVCSVLYRPYLRTYPALPVSAFAMLASVGFLAILAAGEGFFASVPRFTPGGWLAIIFIGVNSGIGYYLWLWALGHAPATQVTVFLALSPITAAWLGAMLLAETISVLSVLGLALRRSRPVARAPRRTVGMTPFHVFLAVLVAVIWGIAFVATKLGLESFSPPQLTALRFLIAAVPVLFVSRPPIAWPLLCAVGLALFAGQFLFQFFGIANGMPPGLAAIVVQTQALFTILFAGVVLKEKPTGRQLSGTAVAFAGLVVIAMTVGRDLTTIGLCLTDDVGHQLGDR